MSAHVVPDDVLAKQREASDPAVSAWVSANAGSGKTYVLVQRVIRLLLDGTDPTKILCLTFTKAAAANMANRVFETLAKWTALDDAALDRAMREIGVKSVDAPRRARARKLFAEALETPGGLKVQTIHAFCTRLLQQFPFEANVAARFAVLDERTESELLDRASLDVLIDAAMQPDSAAGRALATATTAVADQTFRQVINEAIKLRDKLRAWIAGDVEKAIAGLCGPLGVAADDSLERVEQEIVNGPLLPRSEWATVAAVCGAGSASDQRQGDRLLAAIAASNGEQVDEYLSVFLTDKFAPRASVVTAGFAKNHQDLARRFTDEQTRIMPLFERRRALFCRDRTAALLRLADAVITRYRAEKDRRGLLDYDDLIDRALALLDRAEAAWVHYKLDLGIDHVLIDEAQDTSPKQWEIIARLVAEFAAGAGARGALKRTIFAVGDDKQSIFSFQGASPDAFEQKRRDFKRDYDASGLDFVPVEFKHSFRSLQIILDAVDTVFKQPAALRGMIADKAPPAHIAVREQAPGCVEVWPLEKPDKKPAVEPWDAPFDTTSETNPRVKLANKIAKAVKVWIARRDLVGAGRDRHPVQPGDILVLVRNRGSLFEAIIRALKNAGIDVAGADRLVLTEHIAVMDLMALADALLLPDDDLALATVLKSPLFGLDEDQLFKMAWQRKGLSLLASLRRQASADPLLAEVAARIDCLSDLARRETPFTFYARVLGPERGRARMLARLGPEATDALDEFLELALDYERRETPSLQGFVTWLRSAPTEIKRDMEIARNEVRVMTVHGAKGLEAPVVILADTTTPPAGPTQRQPRLFSLPDQHAVPATPARIVWSARKADDVGIVATARGIATIANENEHRRLLYVAMTRAADRLIICGAVGEMGAPKDCWYELVSEALKPPLSAEEDADHGEGKIWRGRKGGPDVTAAAPAALPAAATDEPGWLRAPAPVAAPARATITPSSDDVATRPAATVRGEARRVALARGVLVHRLMQSLPDVAPERRRDAAKTYLARAGRDFSEAEQAALLRQIFAVLDDARLAPLFAPGSRAEVPIVGRIARADGGTVSVSGQIDRLAVTAEAVLIADYKTNRPPPTRLDDVPSSYVRQLALYRALLAKVYPGRAIRAALVWTDVPDLMELSGELLDAALAAAGAV